MIWKTSYKLSDMIFGQAAMTIIDNKVYRVVTLPYSMNILEKLISIWGVLTNRLYPVEWPKPGDFEEIMEK